MEHTNTVKISVQHWGHQTTAIKDNPNINIKHDSISPFFLRLFIHIYQFVAKPNSFRFPIFSSYQTAFHVLQNIFHCASQLFISPGGWSRSGNWMPLSGNVMYSPVSLVSSVTSSSVSLVSSVVNYHLFRVSVIITLEKMYIIRK